MSRGAARAIVIILVLLALGFYALGALFVSNNQPRWDLGGPCWGATAALFGAATWIAGSRRRS